MTIALYVIAFIATGLVLLLFRMYSNLNADILEEGKIRASQVNGNAMLLVDLEKRIEKGTPEEMRCFGE